MRKWKSALKISLILLVISVIITGILNANNLEVLWNISKIVDLILAVVAVISFVGCIVTAINEKKKNGLKTFIISIVVIAVLVGGIQIIVNISNKNSEDHGAQIGNELSKNDKVQQLMNSTNELVKNKEKFNKTIGEFALQYVSKSYNPSVSNVEQLEVDNYGRFLYYVTVNLNNSSKTYFYVVVYDVNVSNNSFKYKKGLAVVEDAGQTPIQKQNAKDYNDWNEPFN